RGVRVYEYHHLAVRKLFGQLRGELVDATDLHTGALAEEICDPMRYAIISTQRVADSKDQDARGAGHARPLRPLYAVDQ
ncbi:MAG TPA: hypothetical protein VLX58_05890, partial [Bryobacteraceae bacterium]|nr:hypothetical protein [Bryobacteraceae bacterium]